MLLLFCVSAGIIKGSWMSNTQEIEPHWPLDSIPYAGRRWVRILISLRRFIHDPFKQFFRLLIPFYRYNHYERTDKFRRKFSWSALKNSVSSFRENDENNSQGPFMIKRTYRGAADLKLLQDFNAAAIAVTDHCGYLHPGDIPHHLYNGNRRYDPAEVLTIWEDEQGVAAWLLVGPRHKSFDAQVRPDLRGGDLEREVLQYAADRVVGLMRRFDIAGDSIYADAFRGDTARVQLLASLGWEAEDGLPYVLNCTKISVLAVPELPDGFSFRSAAGIEDAAALAEVHNASFGAGWTPESYRQVMESPGYEPERELVIQTPDGSFAAFTVTWYDHLNATGLFEPVGTHEDYRRRGFGRALLLYGMQQMAAAGMKLATVANFGQNEAAHRLYQACGFQPWHLQDDYKKYF
jgi:mycothiol synthase